MSDFFLDLRPRAARQNSAEQAAALLTFCEDSRVFRQEGEALSLIVTRVDNAEIWGPLIAAEGETVSVALIGRLALDEAQWAVGRASKRPGGVACKAILAMYQEGGTASLHRLNGNFVVIICDHGRGLVHLLTDPCGAVPCFGLLQDGKPPLLASHPDVLARVAGEESRWDHTSLAEFVITGRVSAPFSYYAPIRALDSGCVYTFNTGAAGVEGASSKTKYFDFTFRPDGKPNEEDLSAQLAEGFQAAVRRRVHPFLGTTGVALSGGLDSRTILCATGRQDGIQTFCLFDDENFEFRTARSIAKTHGVEMIPMRRPFDYYGDSAEDGVRISGGMGYIASNHFLGVRKQLRELGIENLLTGCYCDYMFKGLVQNRSVHPVLRRDMAAPFNHEHYRPCFWLKGPFSENVADRLTNRIPPALQSDRSEGAIFQIEVRRTFPLHYEADLTQRVVPQRVLPWFVPIVDNAILDVFARIPPSLKLSTALYAKAVRQVCGPAITRIPNSNTGAKVDASPLALTIHAYGTALANRAVRRFGSKLTERGSWPNWEYYIHHSSVVRRLWMTRPEAARQLFKDILNLDPYAKEIADYRGRHVELFLRLLTVKLWTDQRLRAGTQS